MQARGRGAVANRAGIEAGSDELGEGDHPVLPFGDERDLGIDPPRVLSR